MELRTNCKGLKGTICVPGDKSISHRSIMFGAIAHGQTRVKGFLKAADCLSTVALFQNLGVSITEDVEDILIEGHGIEAFHQPSSPIDIGNSGTTIRLVSGILAASGLKVTLFGDDSIAKRPMKRVMFPLNKMGANCAGNLQTEFPPIMIEGNPDLQGITYQMPVASAQVKSAILLAGLHATGTTVVIEKEKTRNHTEEMIQSFGGQINCQGKTITLHGPQRLTGQVVNVPGDISSAAFFMVAGLIIPDSHLVIKNVGLSDTRTGIIDVIQAMNGQITISDYDETSKSGTITVSTSQLIGTKISGELIPRLIDELPIIALLATQAKGQTIIQDAQELKVKETNRIDVTASELRNLGCDITPTSDGLIIEGNQTLKSGQVSSHGDHRIGMMLAIAALLVDDGSVNLEKAEAVAVSYPKFYQDLEKLIG